MAPEANDQAAPAELAEAFSDLESPDLTLKGLMSHFGPGVILMMTGIGTSHLVTAPTAGGRFAYALLWCIPLAYVFKYYGFEMAFRFTNATGKSMIEAYSTAWKKWPLWYVLVTTLIQCALGQAGRLIAAAAVLYYIGTEAMGLPFSLTVYGLVLAIVSVVIILRGRYKAVELAAKILAGILVLSTFAVYIAAPAPLSEMGHFFMFEIPEPATGPNGSWLIIAAFLGLLPTGIDVSLQASEWGKAKKKGMSKIRDRMEQLGLATRFDPFAPRREDLTVDTSRLPDNAADYCRRWFKIGIWDFRQGHVVSFLLACIFMLLAAVWLYPSEVAGQAVMGEIARIFTDSIGPAMMVVFMLGAFAATFSTAFNYFDGWPRIVGACCRNLFHGTAGLSGTDPEGLTDEHRKTWYSEYNIYRATMLYSLVASVAIIAGLQRPVFLVLTASALAAFVAPVIFYLNLHYCMVVIPRKDAAFYPSPFARWFGWTSLAVFTFMTLISIYWTLWVPIFGG
ncbi:MAG TPA: Nramp family divalent metal transporter [Longimicrobiales bacterium]|nr:Nramp family divalent metal transporter [Longimicrobiales bacterium]